MPKSKTHLADSFEGYWRMLAPPNAPDFVKEYRFYTGRKWRADYAWPEQMVMVELEGGVFGKGRHTRGMGYVKDCDKYNHAALDGWTLLRYTIWHIDNDPQAVIDQIVQALRFGDPNN